MRISDWSSDVCSSDLFRGAPRRERSGASGSPARHALRRDPQLGPASRRGRYEEDAGLRVRRGRAAIVGNLRIGPKFLPHSTMAAHFGKEELWLRAEDVSNREGE